MNYKLINYKEKNIVMSITSFTEKIKKKLKFVLSLSGNN